MLSFVAAVWVGTRQAAREGVSKDMVIDLGILLYSDKVAPYLSEATIELLEVVLGIFLGALAIQLMLNGLAEVGVITLTGHA